MFKLDDKESEKEDAIEQAWKLAIDALNQGFFVLSNGTKIALTDKDLIRHMQWMATVGKIKPKGFPLPKDIFINKTTGVRDAKEEEA